MQDLFRLSQQLSEALDQGDSSSPWDMLARFTSAWYRKPLSLKKARVRKTIAAIEKLEEGLGFPFPPRLREWFLLVDGRLEPTDLHHPVMELCFRSLADDALLTEKGGLAILGGTELDRPFLLLDTSGTIHGLSSRPDTVAGFLTSSVVWQTIHCATVESFTATATGEPLRTIRGPLGSLHRSARGALIEPLASTEWEGSYSADEICDEKGVEFLREAFAPLAGLPTFEFEGEGIQIVGSESFELLIAIRSAGGQATSAEAGTLGRAHKAAVNSVCKSYAAKWRKWEQAERKRRLEAKETAQQELLSQVPDSDEALLEALEAIEGSLFRFERSFLENFRLQAASGQITEGQRLQAAKILTKAR